MVTLNAHFDGRVFVPDEPIDLKPNERVRLVVESLEPVPTPQPSSRVDFREWIGLALRKPQNPEPRFANDDALWEGSRGDTLVNDPRKHR